MKPTAPSSALQRCGRGLPTSYVRKQSVVFSEADDRFHDLAALNASFDWFRHAAPLSGEVHRCVWQGDAMPLVSLIDGHALRHTPHDLANIFQCGRQGMAVVRISVGSAVDDKSARLGRDDRWPGKPASEL